MKYVLVTYHNHGYAAIETPVTWYVGLISDFPPKILGVLINK